MKGIKKHLMKFLVAAALTFTTGPAAAIDLLDSCKKWNQTSVKEQNQLIGKLVDSIAGQYEEETRRLYAAILAIKISDICKKSPEKTVLKALGEASELPSWAESTQEPPFSTKLDPVYDRAYKGKTYSALGGPFLIEVDDSFFRKSGLYPWREIVADGTFLFIRVSIFNNSDRPLQIPGFTLQDSQGRTYATASRARLFRDGISERDGLNPGVTKTGYLIFDVSWLSGVDRLPMRYKLLIANSRHTIDVYVHKKEEE